ncbi:MAG: phytanoyl-CoA dioxygenase family protein [Candidatus Latescibacteria bacterium]|nr:phytanoyl-CoA dioxygenase family protein [Candidatus Latescibacterota bacterium]
MGMTEEERFRFDLSGFLVRPAILDAGHIAAIRDQIHRIKHDPQSLPPEQRAVPSGPSSILIDHPKVIEVLHEIIGPDIRLEGSYCVWRKQGESHGALHGGGPQQADPIFGYRVLNGRIHAGMVRVVFELTDVGEHDGGTHFIVGSHKANFPMHPDHLSLEEGKRSPFLMSYSCPAGSAVFFTENVCHAGPIWKKAEPRVAVLNAYSHLATHWHRLTLPPEVLAGLPREKQAYFRAPWVADFRTSPATINTIERFVAKGEPPVDTVHQP